MQHFPSKEKMKAAGIFNSWGIGNLAKDKVYVAFSPQIRGCGYRCAKFQVIRIGYKTDPKSHWMDDGQKTFNIFSECDKNTMREKACAWANEHEGKRDWVRDPWGSWQDARTVEIVHSLVKGGE